MLRGSLSLPLLAALIVAAAVMPGGCASSGGQRHATALAAFEAGDYAEAQRMATSDAERASGRKKDEAALIAGMSARALKRDSDAEHWLRPLTTNSRHADIAGTASAELGLLLADNGRHQEAIDLLETSARRLGGDEAARALFQAGESYNAMGRPELAKIAWRRALRDVKDPALRGTIESRLSLSGYTVQLGAFADRANASKTAESARAMTQRLNIDPPRIVERTAPNGRRLFVVQAGVFPSKQEAEAAKSRLGTQAVVARMSTL